ncbi:MAG: hypothetical protein KatS3mg021_2393 [Fimbriimonadales bacterium]|jgi:hypothetical protein|nr:MAG: hypothetical protein KatS3mg021_2393 [Fimbriimonadales bacterium]
MNYDRSFGITSYPHECTLQVPNLLQNPTNSALRPLCQNLSWLPLQMGKRYNLRSAEVYMVCKWCGLETTNPQVCDWCKRHPLGENPELTLYREAELARKQREALVSTLLPRIEQLLDAYASDGLLTFEEEAQILAIVQHHNLTPQELSPILPKWNKLRLLRDILLGFLPQQNENVPIFLKSEEVCHWVTPSRLYEERTKRVYYGAGPGISVRIAKGVRVYLSGGYRTSIPVYEMAELDSGILVITSKRLVFLGSRRTLEKPLKNIVSIQPYSDGIQVHFSNRQKAAGFVVNDADLVAAILHQACQFLDVPRLFRLTVLFPGGMSQEVVVPSYGLAIGRSRENDLVINEPTVSNSHARIAIENNQLVLYDLNSSNGTWVNGRRIVRAVLKPSDVLQIGSVIIKVK